MRGTIPARFAIAVCVFAAAAALLSGCGSKADNPSAAPPMAADAKMGNDYGKGVAAAHTHPGVPQAKP